MKKIMQIANVEAHLMEVDVMSCCYLMQDPMRILMNEEFSPSNEHYEDVVFNINEGRKTNAGFQITTEI